MGRSSAERASRPASSPRSSRRPPRPRSPRANEDVSRSRHKRKVPNMIGFLWFIYIAVCFLLMFIVLIQRGETGGLSSAFGGGGGETAFGVKADVTWKKATAYFAGAFMFL